MKVLAGYDDPTALDLVAHFLGIAMHHNDNAAPSAIPALEVISRAEDVQDCLVRYQARTNVRWCADPADVDK